MISQGKEDNRHFQYLIDEINVKVGKNKDKGKTVENFGRGNQGEKLVQYAQN